MTGIETPMETLRETVRPEWTDYNGHMNLAYFVLIFDLATDRFYSEFGLGEDYCKRTGHSTFAVESHTNYLAELLEAAVVRCTTQLLGFDEKRMHYFHRMYRTEDGALAATMELMAVHVDLGLRKVAPMPDDIQSRLGEIFVAHAALERPPQAGRVMYLGNPVRK